MISIITQKYNSILAVLGMFLLTFGTTLHPMHEDPNDAKAAFIEYAADQNWHTSHLLQLLGVAFLVVLLIQLARVMKGSKAESLALVCTYGSVAGFALACALQAVDGIALKAMVDLLEAAPTDQQQSLFHSALAVRQIEIGLASMFSLLLGAVLFLFGIAQIVEGRFPKWLGIILAIYGLTSVIAGYAMAVDGFSNLVMNINMPASVLLLVWSIAIAYFCWNETDRKL